MLEQPLVSEVRLKEKLLIQMNLLLKQCWSVSDVALYFGDSENTARKAIVIALKESNEPKIDKDNKVKQKAPVDAIIKVKGGVSQKDEIDSKSRMYKNLFG